jgi:putative SOS response-associated peptidase YedK
MCFFYDIDGSKVLIQKSFKAAFETDLFTPKVEVNGFSHPTMPIILDTSPDIISNGVWGLLPNWTKDKSFQKNTLNARIETITEKPSFRNSVNKRCLVLASGFYEWQWLDEKGKLKNKHRISMSDDRLFAFGGIYSEWNDIETGTQLTTYSIVTTEANELMAEIHNIKRRMPIILKKEDESKWLNHDSIERYAYPYEVNLKAVSLG